MNGLETYLAIHEINPDAVVVMMAAYSPEADELIDSALCNQAYACLYKPMVMDEVLALVDAICDKRRGTGGEG